MRVFNVNTAYQLLSPVSGLYGDWVRKKSGGVWNPWQQQVIGKSTGWTAATGTASRATFATSTVTLEQLAQRFKALQDDLTTRGIIGA